MSHEQLKSKEDLPRSLYTTTQVKETEKEVAKLSNIPMFSLMREAGSSCFKVFKKRWNNISHLLVFTGKGNNGGDGYIFALKAKKIGINVQLCQLGDPSLLTGDAAKARDEWLLNKGFIDNIASADFLLADLIVDAILGTGLSGKVSDGISSLIAQINDSDLPVLSVDIPSGLNGDTGIVCGDAVKADATVTFVALKQGLFTGAAAQYCGEIYFDGLGIYDNFKKLQSTDIKRVNYQDYKKALTKRSRISHKGNFGKTLVIGGNLGMPGAVKLSGEAALRTGSGLVKILTQKENIGAIIATRPELMISATTDDLTEPLKWASTIVLGPGLGLDFWAQRLFETVITTNMPMVVDADALNLLAVEPRFNNNWILTPHPGEAARLLNVSVSDIERNRFKSIRDLQDKFGGVVILKGAGTLICDAEQIYVANVGNPGMASAGMGDLLSGIIGGLLAQGLDLLTASILAVSVHGRAGDLAAIQGERGLLASDLFPYIRKLVN